MGEEYPPAGAGPPDALAPDGSEIRYRELGARTASLVEVTLAPGRVTRPLRHRTVEEIWHVLEGHGQLWLRDPVGGERRIPMEPGTTILIPTLSSFQFSSDRGAALRFLCYTSPPWPGDQEAQPVLKGGLGEPR